MNCLLCGVALKLTNTPWRMLGEWSWVEAHAAEQTVSCCPNNTQVDCYECRKPYGTPDHEWEHDPEVGPCESHDHDGPHVPEASTHQLLTVLGVFEQESPE